MATPEQQGNQKPKPGKLVLGPAPTVTGNITLDVPAPKGTQRQPKQPVQKPYLKPTIRQPANPVPPSAQNAGITGSIGDANHKLDTIHQSYLAVNGTPPSPGLALDIMRSPVPVDRYPDLFQLPGVADATRIIGQHLASDVHSYFNVTPEGTLAPVRSLEQISRDSLGESVLISDAPMYVLPGRQKGLVQRGNIDLNNRPEVPTPGAPAGTVSTVRTISIGTDRGEVLIPTVIRVNGKWTVASNQQAIDHYRRTGENLGVFKTVAAANAYSEALHNEQANRPLGAKVEGPPTQPADTGLSTQTPTVRAKGVVGATLQGAPAPPSADLVKQHFPFLRAGFVPGDPIAFLKAVSGPDNNPNSPIYQALKNGATQEQLQRIVRNYYDSQMTRRTVTGNIATGTQDEYRQMQSDVAAVHTVKAGQQLLNKLWGTHLPETGFWNESWARAYLNGQKDATIQYQYATYMAQQEGFSTPEELLKAWKNKVAAARYSGATEWIVNALPMQVFSSGSGFLDVLKGLAEYPFQQHSSNPVTFALHVLTRSAGEGMHVLGGTADQVKADLAATGALVEGITPAWLNGYGKSYDQALKDAAAVIHKNPSWVRVFEPHASDAAVESIGGQLANILGDIVLLRKPAFTGELVRAGDEAAALASPHIEATTHWAYNDLKAGNVARAASRWGYGRGAEQLAVAAEKGVQDGTLTEPELRGLVAQVHLGREVTVDGKTVSGAIVTALAHKELITPGKPGQLWLEVKGNVRYVLDELDQRLRNANRTSVQHAASLVSTMRSAVYHAAPKGARGLYDIGTPEALFNYVLKNFKDPKLAASFEDRFVRLRAFGNTPGLTELNDELRTLYDERFPVRKIGEAKEPQAAPFEPILSTEAPIGFHFPSGGKQDVAAGSDAWDRLAIRWQNRTKQVDDFLNKLAVRHAALIIASGLGTFWKHNIADTAKRFGIQGFHALGPVLSKGDRLALDQAMEADPTIRRAYGMALERNRQMEARYLLWKTGSQPNYVDFSTGEHFANPKMMAAAGGYVRRRADDELLTAYRDSTLGDLTPLAKAILQSRYYRGRFASEMADEIKAVKGEATRPQLSLADEAAAAKGDEALAAFRRGEFRRQLLQLAKDYAPKIAHEFRQFEQAALTAGRTDPWAEVARILKDHPGEKADKAIGEWIAQHRVEFDVRSGVVQKQGRFDQVSSWALNKIMAANKWNRGQLFQREFELKYTDLTREGVKPDVAANIAIDVADRLVRFHMFDFSNRLGIEQDLRYLSYFATKHRLNWKWVLGQMIRKPGMAALVSDVEKNLNQQGGYDFTLFGLPLTIPVARLFWVPGKEYDETSPVVQAIAAGATGLVKTGNVGAAFTAAANSAGGTYGNILTRQDQTISLAVRLLVALSGNATYATATAGLPDLIKRDVWHRMDLFQQEYMAHHHGRPAPESEVVKYALLHSAANQFWQSGLPLPVIPQKTGKTSFDNPLLQQYYSLTDPRAKAKFLREHPDVGNSFGVYTDPAQYAEVQQAWAKINAAGQKLHSTRLALLEQAKRQGWTEAIDAAYRKAGQEYGAAHDAIAKQFPVWAKQTQSDPLLASQGELHKLFPNIPKSQLVSHVPGSDVVQLQAWLKTLDKIAANPSDPRYATWIGNADDYKNVRNDILGLITHLRAYPTDAASRVYDEYQKHLDSYYTWSNTEYQRIQLMHIGWKRDTAEAAYMWERNDRNQPVVIDGVRFPSVAQARFWHMDAVQREKQLSLWASDDWGHLAGYEKILLGVKTTPGLTEGWYFFNGIVAKAHGEGATVTRDQKKWIAQLIDKGGQGVKPHPGFYRDYLFSLQPRIYRFEATAAYRDMSKQAKAEYQHAIAEPARKVLASGASTKDIRTAWTSYVTELLPWMQQNAPELYHYVQDVWPAHLIATLVSR